MPSKILVLEDDENFGSLIQEILQDADFEVDLSHRPEQAIELAQWNQFDLLITDIRMAGVTDGLGASEAIGKLQPHIYRIIMTGYADEEAPSRAMNQGVDYYLYKPFKLSKLVSVAESVLATQRDHSTYQHKLATLYQGAKRFLRFLDTKEEKPALDSARLSFHKAYYAGIQATNLTATGALAIWNKLIPLEVRYERLEQIMGPEADTLATDYSTLQTIAEQYARTRSMDGTRGPIPMLKFSPLYTAIKENSVTFARYMMAPLIWFWLEHRQTNSRYQQSDFASEAQLLFGVKPGG